MSKLKILALAAFAMVLAANAPAKAFCLVNCEPDRGSGQESVRKSRQG